MAKTAEPTIPSVEDAEAEAGEAQALVAALEERIRSGDGSVSAVDLANAKSLAEFARLQTDAARKRAHEAAQADAAREVQRVVEDARSLADGALERVEKLRAAASKAFVAYVEAKEQLAVRARQVANQVELVNLRADSLDVDNLNEHGISIRSGDVTVWTTEAIVTVPASQPDVAELLSAVIEAAGITVDPHSRDISGAVHSNRPWPPKVA